MSSCIVYFGPAGIMAEQVWPLRTVTATVTLSSSATGGLHFISFLVSLQLHTLHGREAFRVVPDKNALAKGMGAK